MRKIRILLSLFILLLIFSANSFAAKNEIINVSMNGSKVSVREVPIILNGQAVVLDDPSFIHIDRTLVPLRFVAESFGAQVDWVQKTKTAVVTLNDKKINLTIDSPNVTINKDSVKLDKNSIPKLVTFANKDDAKTMVPIAFISTVFGYEVGYDEVKKQPFINGETKPIEDETVDLEPETELKPEPEPEPEPVPEKTPDKEEVKEEIEVNKNIISPEEMKNLNQIKGIYLEYINGKQVIVVDGSKDTKYNVSRISNPERVIIDIMDSAFIEGDYFEYDYDLSFIKKVRASQFSGDKNYPAGQRIVRVVLDTKTGEIDPNVNVEVTQGKLVIYPKKSIWENINYNKSNNTISLLTGDKTLYNFNYDTLTKSVEIILPFSSEKYDDDNVKVRDGLIDEIEIIKTPLDTKIRIQFTRSIEYELLSDTLTDEVKFSFKRDSNVKTSDRVIVIDAGHGGKDPGASSPNKVREKDLNLVMALKLESALKVLGYNVVMTRTTDVAVGLYDRPALANEINADIFVSMHANSTGNSAVSGIEVLYSPTVSGSNKALEQFPLGRIVMDEILKATGGKERGVIKRADLVVLNRTKMPAILVETGFLSNANEEKLITNESYQNKMVQGIINGIDSYFEKY